MLLVRLLVATLYKMPRFEQYVGYKLVATNYVVKNDGVLESCQ